MSETQLETQKSSRANQWLSLIDSKLPDVTSALPVNTIQATQLKVAFLAAFNSKPKLRECSQMSVASALISCASVGLVPETPAQHAYLIPRGGECRLEIGYRGFCELMYRTGRVDDIKSGVVHEGDLFEHQDGDTVVCRHIKSKDRDRQKKPIIFAYCLVLFTNGNKKLEVMDAGELVGIEKAMLRQNRGQASPAWTEWRDEMLRKACIKRVAKTSRLNPELSTAAEIDNTGFRQAIQDRKYLLQEDEPEPRTREQMIAVLKANCAKGNSYGVSEAQVLSYVGVTGIDEVSDDELADLVRRWPQLVDEIAKEDAQ